MRYENLLMKRYVLWLFLLKTYVFALQVQRDDRDKILNLTKEKCNDIVDSRYRVRSSTCICSRHNKCTLTSSPSLIPSPSSSPYGCKDPEEIGGTITIYF